MSIAKRLRRFMKRHGLRPPTFLLNDNGRRVRRLAATVGPGDVVIDLGAHVGEVAAEFARRGAVVHAFEAHPAIFAELRKRSAVYPNVHVYNEAVSDTAGPVTLYFRDSVRKNAFYQGSTLAEGKSDLDYSHAVEVPGRPLSEIVAGIGGPVRLLKMDIEGMEYRVLSELIDSGLAPQVGEAFVECHVGKVEGLETQKAEVIARLQAAGLAERYHFDWH